jgi:hypothetical protein
MRENATPAQAGALSRLDRGDLELAAHSFARKRDRGGTP